MPGVVIQGCRAYAKPVSGSIEQCWTFSHLPETAKRQYSIKYIGSSQK